MPSAYGVGGIGDVYVGAVAARPLVRGISRWRDNRLALRFKMWR